MANAKSEPTPRKSLAELDNDTEAHFKKYMGHVSFYTSPDALENKLASMLAAYPK